MTMKKSKTLQHIAAVAVVLLTLCLVFAAPVSAEEVTAENLATQLGAGTSVTLSSNIEVNTQITITSDVTLDLNGHTLTFVGNQFITINSGTLTITNSQENGFIQATEKVIVVNGGNLSLQNAWVKATNAYAIYISAMDDENRNTLVSIDSGSYVDAEANPVIAISNNLNSGVTTAKGVTLDFAGMIRGSNTANGIWIDGDIQDVENPPEIILRDGSRIQMGEGDESCAIYAAGYGSWTFDAPTDTESISFGPDLMADDPLSIKAGTFVINGGFFLAKGLYVENPEADYNGSEPTGSAISITGTDGYAREVSVTINGGKFQSTNGHALFEGVRTSEGSGLDENGLIDINGGIFVTDAALPAIQYTPGDNRIDVTGATIEANNYGALKAALESGVKEVKVIYAIDAGEVTKENRITVLKDTMLNLNGMTITADLDGATSFIVVGSTDGDVPVEFTVTNDITSENGYAYEGYGTIDVTQDGDGCLFYVCDESTLTIRGGTYKAGYYVVASNAKPGDNGQVHADINIDIMNAYFTSTADSAFYIPVTSETIIAGETEITGVTGGLELRSGSVTLSENVKISATGEGSTADKASGDGSLMDGSAIILHKNGDTYPGDIELTIRDNVELSSSNAAAISNYVLNTDIGDVTVTISDNAKLFGTAALENKIYTSVTDVENKGTFTLNGGLYKAAEVTLFKGVEPIYGAGSYLSETADEDGFYAVVQKPLTIIYHSGLTPDSTQNIELYEGIDTVTIAENYFACDNAVFLGWNATSVDGTWVDYSENADVALGLLDFGDDHELHLYAVWKSIVTEEKEIEATVTDGVTQATLHGATKSGDVPDNFQFENATWIEWNDNENVALAILFENSADNESFDGVNLNKPILGAMALIYGSAADESDDVVYSDYRVSVGMSNLTSIPAIDGTIRDEVVTQLTTSNKLSDEGWVLTMISADNVDNNNITTVGIQFYIEKFEEETEENFVAYHVSGTEITPLTVAEGTLKIDGSDKDYWVITLYGSGFSSYVIGYEPSDDNEVPGGDGDDEIQGGDNSDNNNQNTDKTPNYNGGGGKKPTTVTPTVPPTEEPTDDPTDVPDEPELPETPVTPEQPETPATPAPILAVLAGLGAAVVLRRK